MSTAIFSLTLEKKTSATTSETVHVGSEKVRVMNN
jgi:hypothetical protein